MSRRPRLQFPGATYHVMTRGNRKSSIFKEDDDRWQFLDTLERALRYHDARCTAMCLMLNHYHVILQTPRANLSAVMRYVNGVYAKAMNRKHGLTGHLFEARYRASLIERETYLKRATRYVVRNPVRAHMVSDPADYVWSSFRATAGLAEPPSWLSLEWLDWAYKTESREEAHRRYAAFVRLPTEKKRLFDSTALAIGNAAFKARVAAAIAERRNDRLLPRRKAPFNRPTLRGLFADGGEQGMPIRDRNIYRARVEHGYSLAEIATFLNLHPSSVSKAFKRSLECGRDDSTTVVT